ncbi:MAG: hypothetical protein K1X71_19425 [Pirellulales bacterium]|nr:hypothetical protein [Pirellulales bacterium]
MKRLFVAALLLMAIGSSTGCCIIDHLFHCPCGRWRGGGCGPYGDCGSCGSCGDSCTYGGGAYDGGGYDPVPGCSDCARRHGGGGESYAGPQGPPGPPVGQVAYPYYTTRGPRDFLARNPGDIGP